MNRIDSTSYSVLITRGISRKSRSTLYLIEVNVNRRLVAQLRTSLAVKTRLKHAVHCGGLE